MAKQTGIDWLDKLLAAQGRIEFELAWSVFTMGQLGAAYKYAPATVTKDMLDTVEGDVNDLSAAVEEYVKVVSQMVANARSNLQ